MSEKAHTAHAHHAGMHAAFLGARPSVSKHSNTPAHNLRIGLLFMYIHADEQCIWGILQRGIEWASFSRNLLLQLTIYHTWSSGRLESSLQWNLGGQSYVRSPSGFAAVDHDDKSTQLSNKLEGTKAHRLNSCPITCERDFFLQSAWRPPQTMSSALKCTGQH